MKKLLLPLLATALFLAGCGTAVSAATNTAANQTTNVSTSQPISKSPLVGKMAPKFSLQTLNEKSTVSLQQLLAKKKILLINAWASWCYPCQQETPDLIAMSKKYAGQVQFVGVNMTSDDSVSAATTFVQKYGISYPVLLDLKGTFAHNYQIIGYPTTFVLDPNGTLVNIHLGLLTKDQIEQLITQAKNGIAVH
ncbi:TlpA family protein disulfide reductase [Ferroacidibacillus organovorans]|uniref:Thioredoxin domain-containing protein n=1 Tax=Ferroacidibacillus organovorans TaxID=1765683 RepID=A0A853KE00_9BACL|nr:TlpA disulfide reductase family protein [Ferroacidibacillus organovorans]KYP79938.1 hypothetical protein AYJ22_03305 [Ferroacidibacillus organovorans]OAG94584.1 hypothetical protein AYW79_04310 [Ferroacidibacillus organovorans]